jgi:hypothetical protein
MVVAWRQPIFLRGDTSVVLVGCAYGWYRGPDGQCYVGGTGKTKGRAMQKQAVAYIRTSTTRQNLGLEAQAAAITSFAAHHGFDITATLD